MRKFLLLAAVPVLALLAGCASTDPITVNNLTGLREGHVEMMDAYDALATKHGEPTLDSDFRDAETGKYDDALDYERSKSK